jgi:S-(hydroxymethyl)glutathione dehydrogenase/alcohol dehydrogenase
VTRARAALLRGIHQPWAIEEIDVHEPRRGEVLVRWRAAGLCHSDEHLVTGDMVPPPELTEQMGFPDFFPIVGGHEGAGVVEAVGPGVLALQPGDHVAASFVPTCGRCRSCLSGRGFLCDAGAGTMVAGMSTDGTHRHFCGEEPIALFAKLGTFAEQTCVAEESVVKIADDLPFDVAALVSCGVATGWGSATRRADVQPGETVVVVGIGGVGINAVQGARYAGATRIIAIDPIAFKRDTALRLGATEAFASIADAIPEVASMTGGQMADKVIMTPGVLHGDLIQPGLMLVGKAGTMVLTAVAPMMQREVSISLFELVMWGKEIKGTIFGGLTPRIDVPALLERYRAGDLELDGLITHRYALDEINDGYDAMRAGTNIRGVVVYDG